MPGFHVCECVSESVSGQEEHSNLLSTQTALPRAGGPPPTGPGPEQNKEAEKGNSVSPPGFESGRVVSCPPWDQDATGPLTLTTTNWLSGVSSLQVADHGPFRPPYLVRQIPYNRSYLPIYIFIRVYLLLVLFL